MSRNLCKPPKGSNLRNSPYDSDSCKTDASKPSFKFQSLGFKFSTSWECDNLCDEWKPIYNLQISRNSPTIF